MAQSAVKTPQPDPGPWGGVAAGDYSDSSGFFWRWKIAAEDYWLHAG